MSNPDNRLAERQPRRWLGPALLASAALNLFLVGLISVPFFMGPHHDGDFRHPPRGPMPGLFHESFRDLPKEDRQAIREVMIGHFPAIKPHLRAMHEAKTGLADALAAEPYDEAAVSAAFEKMDESMRQMASIGRDAMMAGFAKLTPEQRKRVAEVMRERRERVKLRWHRRDGEPEMPPGDMPPEDTEGPYSPPAD